MNVVHRVWIGGEEPEWTRGFAASWERAGYRVCQWGDTTVEALFPLHNQELYDRAPELAPNHVGQLRTDVLRYELLYRFGGVYVDADMECLRPLDELVEGVRCWVGWELEGRWLNNAIMGTDREGDPFLAELIEGLERSVRRNQGARPNRMSGPQYLTHTWRRRGRGHLHVFPQRYFYPYSWNQLHRDKEEFADAYTVHHWSNQRRERGIPLRARGSGTRRGSAGAARAGRGGTSGAGNR